MANAYQIVLTTCADAAAAQALARAIVEERLAACVNIIAGVRSIYRWQGHVESADEHLLLIKSTVADYPQLEQRIQELHPYELPEIVALPIGAGLERYLAWIDNPDAV